MHRTARGILALLLGSFLLAACASKRPMSVAGASARGEGDASPDNAGSADEGAPPAAPDSRGALEPPGGAWDSGAVLPDAAPAPDQAVAGSCGNRTLDRGEQCDDGNTSSGDGCSRLCQIEDDWPPCPYGPCVVTAVCGNGVRTSDEACDDANRGAGDGCAADCRSVEPGWICRAPGRRCVPLCGDGHMNGGETCDDGNTAVGDGCSMHCLTEAGWACQDGGCTPAGLDGGGGGLRCGDGVLSGAEECDDGADNGTQAYGGCTNRCFFGPFCGDGVTDGDEECDLGSDNGKVGGQGGCTIGCLHTHFCGDGIVDTVLAEECDLADRNGVRLDTNLNPTGDGSGTVFCMEDCRMNPENLFSRSHRGQ